MNIQIIRTKQGFESTLSAMIVDGVHRGYIPEDTDRGLTSSMSLDQIKKLKVYGRTAPPTGRFPVKMTWSPKFNRIMPQVMGVIGYDGVRFHSGNLVTQTDACFMPGETYDQDKLGYYRVWNSKKVFEPLYLDIQHAINRNETVWCEVTRLYKIQV